MPRGGTYDRSQRHPRTAPGAKKWSAARQLAALSKAGLAFRNAIARLDEVADLEGFLEKMLLEGLRAAGSGSGAVVLVEGEPGHEVAHHIVILANGQPMSREVKRANGMERVPFDAALRAYAERVASCDDGCFTRPDDALYPPGFRDFLHGLGVVATTSTALRIGGRMIGWFGVGYFDDALPTPTELALHRLMADQMAVTMEVTRLAERSRQAAIEQERSAAARLRAERIERANATLISSVVALADGSGVDSMFGYILKALLTLFPGSRGSALWLIDTGRQLQYRHMGCVDGQLTTGLDVDDPGSLPRPIHPALFPPRQAAVQPRLMRSAELPADRREHLARFGAADAAAFPMYLHEEPLGAFTVALPAGAADPAIEDLQIAQALAHQGTLALQLRRLAEHSERAAVARERELAAHHRVDELARANRALTASLDAVAEDHDGEHALGRLLQVIAEQVDCDSAALCLRRENSDVFQVELAWHENALSTPEADAPSTHLCPARGNRLWRALIADRKPVLIERPRTGSGPMRAWFERAGVHTLLGVPLIQRRRVIGCLTFVFPRQRTFAAGQIELLQTLAHQATLAVQLDRSARIARDESRQTATLAERARIARDLHDTLAQGLTGILMQLQAALRAPDPEQSRLRVQAALDNARGALVDARRSVHALRSIADERIDFVVALKGVLKTTFAGSAVASRVELSGALPDFAEATETELLRIVQEASTNSLKHAHASCFTVRLNSAPAGFEMLLDDDGVGFDPRQAAEGFGLLGIGERAADLGAEMSVEGAKGRGTRIRLLLPRRAQSAVRPSP